MVGVPERVIRGGFRIEDRPFRGATSRGESDQPHAVGDGGVEIVKRGDAVDDVPRVVRDAFEANGVVLARAHESKLRDPHVLHRANGAGDVHRVLRLVQDHRNSVETRFWHAGKVETRYFARTVNDRRRSRSWRSARRYTNSPEAPDITSWPRR